MPAITTSSSRSQALQVEAVEEIDYCPPRASGRPTSDWATSRYGKKSPTSSPRMTDRRDFNLVVSFQVIEHPAPNQETFLAACARRTKPCVSVAIATPNRLGLDDEIRSALRRDPVPARRHALPQDFACQELETMARSVNRPPIASFTLGLTLTIPPLGRPAGPAARRHPDRKTASRPSELSSASVYGAPADWFSRCGAAV